MGKGTTHPSQSPEPCVGPSSTQGASQQVVPHFWDWDFFKYFGFRTPGCQERARAFESKPGLFGLLALRGCVYLKLSHKPLVAEGHLR